MDLEQAISYALDGDAVIFLGSGFSTGAIKADGNEFCSAKSLAHRLLLECGFKDNELLDDLGQASEIYQEVKSEHELVEFMLKEFTAVQVNSDQNSIGSVKWKRVYTTNYDNVIEQAFLNNSKLATPVVLSQKLSDYKDKSNLCIHLNGRVDGLTIQKLNNEFKFTNKSYLTEEFRKSEWLSLFRTDLLTAKAVFFVGYSMNYDLDIQRLVSSLDNLQSKTFFILKDGENATSQLLIKKFGQPCPIGIKQFAEFINKAKKNHVPAPTRLSPYLCFKKIESPRPLSSIVDSEVLRFLLMGEYETSKLYYSTLSPQDYKYCIRRTKLQSVIDAIEASERNCLIHSKLGNGKTVFIEALSSMLAQKGYSVYRYYRYMATFPTELETICKEQGKVALVFEDYSGCLENLKILKQFHTDQVLILSERTFVNEANYDVVNSLFGEFANYDINNLDDEEIDALVNLLSHYGFWSYMSAKGDILQREFIKKECNACLRDVVLNILKSPQIVNRFKKIVDTVKRKEGFYEAIIFMLVSKVCHIELGIEDLAEAIDISKINSPNFKKDPVVREFINFDENTILPKSSILSQTILSQIFDTDIIVNTLIKIMNHLSYYGKGKVAKQIIRRLMTYTNIQQVLNETDPNHKYNLIRYYEELKSLPSCRNNPHFWLQYAIVMLSERNYPQAKLYFDAAYGFGKELNDFDTYQIDNHYARYILENEIISGSPDTCMEAFRNAHAILMDVKHKVEVRYYPYKVARQYYPFYEKFFKMIKPHEQKEFISSCKDMLTRLEWYESISSEGGSRKEVKLAKEGISNIIRETHM